MICFVGKEEGREKDTGTKMLSKRRNILIFYSQPRFTSAPARPFKNCSLGSIARPNRIYVPKFSTRPNIREVEKLMSQSTPAFAEGSVKNLKNPKKETLTPQSERPKIRTILKGGAKEPPIKRSKIDLPLSDPDTKSARKNVRSEKKVKSESKKSFEPTTESKEETTDKTKGEKEKQLEVQENSNSSSSSNSENNDEEGEKEENEYEDQSDEEDQSEEDNSQTDSESDSHDVEMEEKSLANALMHPLKVPKFKLFSKVTLLFSLGVLLRIQKTPAQSSQGSFKRRI